MGKRIMWQDPDYAITKLVNNHQVHNSATAAGHMASEPMATVFGFVLQYIILF